MFSYTIAANCCKNIGDVTATQGGNIKPTWNDCQQTRATDENGTIVIFQC